MPGGRRGDGAPACPRRRGRPRPRRRGLSRGDRADLRDGRGPARRSDHQRIDGPLFSGRADGGRAGDPSRGGFVRLARARARDQGRKGARRLSQPVETDADLAADHPLFGRGGDAAGGDAERGPDPLRRAGRSLRAGALLAPAEGRALGPPALSRTRRAALRLLERLRLRPARGGLRRRRRAASAATSASASRTTSRCPGASRSATNADLVGIVARALDGLGLSTQSADGLREEIADLMR